MSRKELYARIKNVKEEVLYGHKDDFGNRFSVVHSWRTCVFADKKKTQEVASIKRRKVQQIYSALYAERRHDRHCYVLKP